MNYEESLLDVFGNSLGSFRNSVPGKFSWEDQLDCWLNFSGRKCSSLVESDEFGAFSGNSVESIMDERIHDVHSFLGDSDIWVYLF